MHHIGQDSRGPLVETSTKHYNPKNQAAFRPLHNQFGGKKNPNFPVKHDNKWRADVKQHWKDRIEDFEQ